ncbi:MAG: sulfatase-like hydrolase/transferase [Acidimicrobiales bacterium]
MSRRPEVWPTLRAAAELLALTGLAITQPLLDLFGNAPDVFLFRDSDSFAIIAFALVVALGPTLVLLTIEVLVGIVAPSARGPVHLAFIAGLSALLALQLVKHLDLTAGAVAVLLALGGAALAVIAYRRLPTARLLLLYLGLAPVLFIGVFLTASPTSDLLDGQEVAAADVAPARQPRSVVFLQLDEWPLEMAMDQEGAIDRELYPNLAALADEGTWYRNATTVATFTSYAVPAILTGRYPDGSRTAVASDYPENLFTLLASQFDLDVIETAARLCPPNLCDEQLVDHPAPQEDSEPEPPPPPSPPEGLWALLDDAAGTYQTLVSPDPEAVSSVDALQQEARVVTTTTPPPTTRPTQGPSTDAAVDDAAAGEAPAFAPAGLAGIPVLELDAVGQLVDSIEPGEDPTLHYLHLLLPHAPYHFLPSGQTYDPNATLAGGISEISGTRSTEQRGADVDRQRLVLQAMYVDKVVGDVIDRLQETGLAEDTLVVVVADHGVGLQPGATPRPTTPENMTEDAYPDMLPVPMLLRGPGIEPGAINDDNVETIDVMPTLADLLGIDIPWPVDGIAVTTERRPDDDKRFHLVSFDGGMIGPTTVGPATPYDGAEVFAEALDRTVDSLFRTDNPDHRVYDLDEAGELVGARVDALTSTTTSRVSVVLDDPDALADVDPPSGVLRTHLVGRVEGLPDGEQVTVAVALNGRVAAVVTTWPEGGVPHQLEAMLVPDFLRAGANELAFYRVDGPEGARTLTALDRSG